MIEVRTSANTAPVPQLVAATAVAEEKSGKGTASSLPMGNAAVEKTVTAKTATENVTEADSEQPLEKSSGQTEAAVKEVNQFVQSVQRDLHFSVDKDSGVTVVRVKDKESGELIRQIPEDIFLNLAKDLKENNQMHLLDTHG